MFLAFAHYQFHLEFRSFLFAPVRDRLEQVGSAVALDLEQTPASGRTGLMGRYAASYGVDFYLFDNDGTQLGGRPVQLPSSGPGGVAAQTRRPAAALPRFGLRRERDTAALRHRAGEAARPNQALVRPSRSRPTITSGWAPESRWPNQATRQRSKER